MVADQTIFRDLAYVFLAAVVGGALARLARQPLILGYVLAGLLVGPFTPGPMVSHIETFELLAEIGVVLLMFTLGVELSLTDLLRVKWLALAGAPAGLAAFIALTAGVGWQLGWPPVVSLSIGSALCVQSTMVAARLLTDSGELGTRHGRVIVGILVVEDLAAVVLMVLLPELGSLGRDVVPLMLALGTAAAILVPFVFLARRIVPWVLHRVARTRSDELFLFVALAVALVTAALTQACGLSLALGAFLAGLVISESDYCTETLERLLPLKDTFVALFFVTMGLLVDPARVLANLPLLGVMTALVVVGNLAIWTLVVRLLGESAWTALLVAVSLTQIGEFSFVLIQVARRAGHVDTDVYYAVLATSLLTILLNAFLVRVAPRWLGELRLARADVAPVSGLAPGPRVLLCGYGRVGSVIGEALDTFRLPYTVLETDPDIVKALHARGVPAIFGDAGRRHVLDAAGAASASLVVLALPAVERTFLAIRHLRALDARLPILARAHGEEERDRLLEAGATEVIQPELEAAATLTRHSLERAGVAHDQVLAYMSRLRDLVDYARPEDGTAGDALPRMRDVTIAAGDVADRTLGQSRVRERFGVSVLMLKHADGTVVTHPHAETVLRPGDRARVFGLPEQIERFAAACAPPAAAAAT